MRGGRTCALALVYPFRFLHHHLPPHALTSSKRCPHCRQFVMNHFMRVGDGTGARRTDLSTGLGLPVPIFAPPSPASCPHLFKEVPALPPICDESFHARWGWNGCAADGLEHWPWFTRSDFCTTFSKKVVNNPYTIPRDLISRYLFIVFTVSKSGGLSIVIMPCCSSSRAISFFS